MGRPAKDINPEMVRKLAKLGCTQEEIGEFVGCARSVISERFGSDFELGRVDNIWAGYEVWAKAIAP